MSDKVFITKRGKVYHRRRTCEWLAHAQERHLTDPTSTLHPLREVSLSSTKRSACRHCANDEFVPR